jgi:hypothetical protein
MILQIFSASLILLCYFMEKKTFEEKNSETVKSIFCCWMVTMRIDGSIDFDFFHINYCSRCEEQGSLSKLMLKLDNGLMNQSPHALLHIKISRAWRTLSVIVLCFRFKKISSYFDMFCRQNSSVDQSIVAPILLLKLLPNYKLNNWSTQPNPLTLSRTNRCKYLKIRRLEIFEVMLWLVRWKNVIDVLSSSVLPIPNAALSGDHSEKNSNDSEYHHDSMSMQKQ